MVTSSEANLIHAELSWAGTTPPLTAQATVTSFVERRCELATDLELPPLAADTGVTLRFENRPSMEVVGLVRQHVGRSVVVHVTRVSHHEKRYFPREFGGIDLRWQRLSEPDAPTGHEDPSGDDDAGWNTPHPFMNFSASGLRFRDSGPCEPGDVLVLRFRPQGRDHWHRATASVIRTTAPSDGGAAEIAVAFRDIGPQAIQTLADYTLDRQLDELARRGLTGDR